MTKIRCNQRLVLYYRDEPLSNEKDGIHKEFNMSPYEQAHAQQVRERIAPVLAALNVANRCTVVAETRSGWPNCYLEVIGVDDDTCLKLCFETGLQVVSAPSTPSFDL